MAFTRKDRDPTESRGQTSHLKQGFSQMGGYLSREVWDSWDRGSGGTALVSDEELTIGTVGTGVLGGMVLVSKVCWARQG